jgi:hypothetical protein
MRTRAALTVATTFSVHVFCSAALPAERATTVPIDLVGNYPIVVVDVDGHKVHLLFDLGEDSDLVLTQAALEELRITPNGPGHAISDVKGNVMQSPTFTVPRLQMGGAVFVNVAGRVDAHDPSYQSTHVGQQGYIGPSLLHDYQVILDYRHSQMTLVPTLGHSADRQRCKGAVVPFLPEWDGAPVTKVHTDLGDLTVVWDTGAPVSFIRRARAEEAHANLANEIVTTKQFRLNDIDFGPLDLRVLEFSQPAGADGFVGSNFFAQHVVCIDLPGKRFLIHD